MRILSKESQALTIERDLRLIATGAKAGATKAIYLEGAAALSELLVRLCAAEGSSDQKRS